MAPGLCDLALGFFLQGDSYVSYERYVQGFGRGQPKKVSYCLVAKPVVCYNALPDCNLTKPVTLPTPELHVVAVLRVFHPCMAYNTNTLLSQFFHKVNLTGSGQNKTFYINAESSCDL